MQLSLDPGSPVPLYHQIAEAIRYRIATGQLRADDRLLPLRTAAEQWDVNLHTVRRAYAELARTGLVQIRRPRAARVLGLRHEPIVKTEGLEAFLFETTREARERFGLSAARLSALIRTGCMPSVPRIVPEATFVECSALQAADYAEQIATRWAVRVGSWPLERRGEPPSGPIISTYFHFNELRTRWPARHGDMHFVTVRLDDSLVGELAGRARGVRKPTVVLAETKQERAAAVLGDVMGLARIEKYRVVTRVVARPGETLGRMRSGTAVLFAPRLWARLTESERRNPRAVQLRYLVDSEALAELSAKLGWSAADTLTLQAS